MKFTQPFSIEYERGELHDLSQNNIENKLQLGNTASLLLVLACKFITTVDKEFLEERGGGSYEVLSNPSSATYQSVIRLHFVPHSDS